MGKEASLEQWKKLYEVAIKLKEMKPWESLWDMDLITILPSEKEEPCVCSIMGKAGNCYAIGTYIGFYAIHGFFQLAENNDMPPDQLIRYQNNIMCYFGDREELTTKELKVIKDLGLKFRGRNNWIFFRVFEQGYAPYTPDEKQVIKLTEILQHLYMAIKAMEKGLTVDFEGGNTLVRRFDEESVLWINYEAPMFNPEVEYNIPVLQDDVCIQRLKKQKNSKEKLELDIAYLNSVINDRAYDKPLIPRICILADGKTGMLLDQIFITPEDEEVNVVFNIVFNYIMQRGIPKTIFVRDMYIKSILLDVCKRIGIDLEVKTRLKNIDEFLRSFSKRGF